MTFLLDFGEFCDVIQLKQGRNITFSWKLTETKTLVFILVDTFLSNFDLLEHLPQGAPVKDIEGQRPKNRGRFREFSFILSEFESSDLL